MRICIISDEAATSSAVFDCVKTEMLRAYIRLLFNRSSLICEFDVDA